MKLTKRQTTLLRRLADGEKRFDANTMDRASIETLGQIHDDLRALARAGLCSEPRAMPNMQSRHGGNAVLHANVTDAGRKALEEDAAGARPPSPSAPTRTA